MDGQMESNLILAVVIFAMFCLVAFNNQSQRPLYRCPICKTTRQDEHDDECPWKQ